MSTAIIRFTEDGKVDVELDGIEGVNPRSLFMGGKKLNQLYKYRLAQHRKLRSEQAAQPEQNEAVGTNEVKPVEAPKLVDDSFTPQTEEEKIVSGLDATTSTSEGQTSGQSVDPASVDDKAKSSFLAKRRAAQQTSEAK